MQTSEWIKDARTYGKIRIENEIDFANGTAAIMSSERNAFPKLCCGHAKMIEMQVKF